MSADDFMLTRNAAGRLVFTDAQGVAHVGVVPVRAFPISAPGAGVSLLGDDGHELRWIARRNSPSANSCRRSPASTTCPASPRRASGKWQVTTDRGDTELLLKAEDHIRRLAPATLLVTNGHGVSYLIRNPEMMDHHSRKLLDRFL